MEAPPSIRHLRPEVPEEIDELLQRTLAKRPQERPATAAEVAAALAPVALEGSKVVLRATLNGKSVRKALKVIAEHGAENVNAVLQGNLKPPTSPGGPFVLDTAGLTAMPKTPKKE